MATITLKGNTVHTMGYLPEIGSMAKDFSLTTTDLTTKNLTDFQGKNIVMNIFPSIDTGTCAMSVRKFNEEAANKHNTVVLCISKDLPFAQARFCGAEGIENVVMLSDYKTGDFGKQYGVTIIDGPLEVLLSRAIVVLNSKGEVLYTEQVAEIADEPNYEKALESIK